MTDNPARVDPIFKRNPGLQGVSNQPMPTPFKGGQPSVQQELIDYLEQGGGEDPGIQKLIKSLDERRQVGVERYGQELFVGARADINQDLYEELLDAMVYAQGLAMGEDKGQISVGLTVRGYMIALCTLMIGVDEGHPE